MPVEKFDRSAAKITTGNKRFDRYFLLYPDRATDITNAQRKLIEEKIRETCVHMRTNLSSKWFLSTVFFNRQLA